MQIKPLLNTLKLRWDTLKIVTWEKLLILGGFIGVCIGSLWGWQIPLIIILNVITYWRSLKFHFICDDLSVFAMNIPKPKEYWKQLLMQTRGAAMWDPKWNHTLNIIVHTIVCILIYLVAGYNHISLLAALLFAISPNNNQCSIWISGRWYAISAIIGLTMFLFQPLGPMWVWLSCFGSLNTLFTPLMFGFTAFPLYALLALIPLTYHYKLIFQGQKMAQESNDELGKFRPRKIIIYFKLLGWHLVNCIFGSKVSFYQPYLYTYGVDKTENKKAYKPDVFMAIGIGYLLLTLGSFFWYNGQWSMTWCLWWFLINMSMWCGLITCNQINSMRYNYLANVGLMVALSILLQGHPFLTGLFLAGYFVRLWYFMPDYQNDYWHTEYFTCEEPKFFYVWMLRGNKRFAAGHFQEALANYNEAKLYRPKDFKLQYNISSCWIGIGNTAAAKLAINMAAAECVIDGKEKEIEAVVKDRINMLNAIEEKIAKKEPVQIPLESIRILN